MAVIFSSHPSLRAVLLLSPAVASHPHLYVSGMCVSERARELFIVLHEVILLLARL